MAQSTEERLARLEALFEMEETTARDLQKRLTKIETSLNELVMDFHSAKVAGRITIGAAAVIGSIVTAAVTWYIQIRGQN